MKTNKSAKFPGVGSSETSTKLLFLTNALQNRKFLSPVLNSKETKTKGKLKRTATTSRKQPIRWLPLHKTTPPLRAGS